MPESLSFDRVADRYDATRVHPAEASAEIAAGLMRVGGIQAGAEVLEIGIGTGRIALPLLASGVNVTGSTSRHACSSNWRRSTRCGRLRRART